MKLFAKITGSIRNVFLAALVACYIIAGILIVYFVNSQMKQQALHDASDRARLVLYRSLSEHEYFTNHLKPNLLNDISHLYGKDYFDPIWMSSTYVVREMDKELRKSIKEEYYYKEAALNARNKENEANEYEAAFLSELNHGSKSNEVQAIREINREKFFTYMIKGETLVESCMRCHGSPADAPKMMVRKYGDRRGFNKKTGEVVSAISIRIPLDDAFEAANSFSARLSLVLLLVLFAILSVCYFIYRQFILVPVMTIKNKAIAIVNSTEHLGEQIPVYYENELGELTKAFNWLSGNMRQLLDGLETKVKERTEKYEKVNLELMEQIQHRQKIEDALKESEQKFRSIFDNSPAGIAICMDHRIVRANKSFIKMFGYGADSEIENLLTSGLLSVANPENTGRGDDEEDEEWPDNRFFELTGTRKDNSVFPVSAGFARLNLPEGNAVVAIVSDRTELQIREEEVKSSLKEKETLLKEIHHRVKNNLQVISSLLNLQMQFIEDEKLRLLFNDSCSRVRSMSLIHEKLYQTKSLSKINMKDYVLDLSMFLKSAYVKDSQKIEIITALDEVHLPVDMAVPCGLIINELVSNSLKYAFRGLSSGRIGIMLKKDEKKIEISISDNGVGLPGNIDLKNPSTLGLQLVSGLTEQVRGTIEIVRKEGTKFCLTFSVE